MFFLIKTQDEYGCMQLNIQSLTILLQGNLPFMQGCVFCLFFYTDYTLHLD